MCVVVVVVVVILKHNVISYTQELACLLLRRLQDKSLFVHKTGPSGTAMCAAAVVAACRENGVPSAIKVVAAASSVKAGDLSKKYRVSLVSG